MTHSPETLDAVAKAILATFPHEPQDTPSAQEAREIANEMARAALDAMPGVAVKPLAWEADDCKTWQRASAPFGGQYLISQYAGMTVPVKLETRGFFTVTDYFPTLEAAQAAAQADYDARIRSALVT